MIATWMTMPFLGGFMHEWVPVDGFGARFLCFVNEGPGANAALLVPCRTGFRVFDVLTGGPP